MATFPSSLGSCDASYSITPRDVVRRSEMTAGMTHNISLWSKPIIDIAVKWTFTQEQLAVFEVFYRDTIKNGTVSFTIPSLIVFGDYVSCTVRFTEHLTEDYADWMTWEVSGKLETVDYGLMSESSMLAGIPTEPIAGYITLPATTFGNPSNTLSVEQNDYVARGNIDGGAFAMSKRVGHLSSTKVQLEYQMTREQMNLFYAWCWYKLSVFSKWFYAYIPYRGTWQSVQCRMTEPPKSYYSGINNGNGLWVVSFVVDVYERNYWELEDCQTLTPSLLAPYIISTSDDLICDDSDYARTEIAATGSQPIEYQWYFEDSEIEGATNSYYIFQVSLSNYGAYTCIATNEYGSMESGEINVYITPTFTIQPEWEIGITTGDDASITCDASGSGSITYQWYKDDVLLDGETSKTFSLESITREDSGVYNCIATSEYGETRSDDAALYVDFFISILESSEVEAGLYFSDEESAVAQTPTTEVAEVTAALYFSDAEDSVSYTPGTESLTIGATLYFLDEEDVT